MVGLAVVRRERLTALNAPLVSAAPVTVAQQWPALGSGARGDQVVWMQQYLAAAEPQASITGIFDAATLSALEAFQLAHGLRQRRHRPGDVAGAAAR